ncbi:DedA family protein [Siculibacillus lacustris]|uniref:DedA family protein n=1 Tax=Siculibacillus lacustris TaxID=1549641 RepID=A0A4Q9VEC6_9HYPH|nr:DedA family protein [Siculibacillus lacustris]TBW32312.1 DedA family protein [Siculibacillus lacustris]
MDIASLFDAALAWISDHRAWAGVVYGLMAFGESMVVLGVLIPATGVMMAAGALVADGTLPFLDLWIGGAVGAALGDTVSYRIGRWLGPGVHRIWPFSTRPEMLAAAERLFARWGWIAVVVGRFIGPLRASIPTVAGMAEMPAGLFQAANIGSAILWIPVLVFPGTILGWAWALAGSGDTATAAWVAGGLVVAVVAAWVAWRRWSPALFAPPPDGT